MERKKAENIATAKSARDNITGNVVTTQNIMKHSICLFNEKSNGLGVLIVVYIFVITFMQEYIDLQYMFNNEY